MVELGPILGAGGLVHSTTIPAHARRSHAPAIGVPYRPVQLHQLAYFVAVAEERHFTRAAARLHVAQPSVSAQIRKLETELGTALFHRGPGEVSVTQAGEVLLPLARQVLADVEEAIGRVREVGELRRGRLAVGATPSLSSTLLPAALVRYHHAHPGVTVQVVEDGSRRLVAGLQAGEIEVALVILPVRAEQLATVPLATVPLAEEELVLVVPPGHRLAATRSSLSVEDLRDVALVMFRDGYDLRAATVAACRSHGFEPSFVAEGGEMDGVLSLVEAGLGAAVVPSIVVAEHPRLCGVRFRPAELRRTIGLAYRGGVSPSRAAEAFAAEVSGLLGGDGWPGPVPAGLRIL